MHASFIPGDPARMARLALWSLETQIDLNETADLTSAHPTSGDPTSGDPSTTSADAEFIRVLLPSDSGIVEQLVPAQVFDVATVLDQLVRLHLDDPAVSPSLQSRTGSQKGSWHTWLENQQVCSPQQRLQWEKEDENGLLRVRLPD